MLIKLSSDQYVFSDKITHMGKNWDYESSGLWRVTFGTEENVLILSQAHFDELLSCLPTPVEASKEDYDEEVENDVGHGTYIVEIGGSHG